MLETLFNKSAGLTATLVKGDTSTGVFLLMFPAILKKGSDWQHKHLVVIEEQLIGIPETNTQLLKQGTTTNHHKRAKTITNHQQATTNDYKLPQTTSKQPQTTRKRLETTSNQPQNTNKRPQTNSKRPQTVTLAH